MRAAVAIAHKILVAAYHMLAQRSDYRELGADYLDQLHHHRTAINLTNRLRAMGYDVQIAPRPRSMSTPHQPRAPPQVFS